jgi:recombination protein RecT
VNNFDAMAKKTVLKDLISKYAPMSVEMQQAIKYDQSVILTDPETGEEQIEYVDNPKEIEIVDKTKYITKAQVMDLANLIGEDVDKAKMLYEEYGYNDLNEIKSSEYDEIYNKLKGGE